MLTAIFAKRANWLVSAFMRRTYDGHAVVVFLCGGDEATRPGGYAEILVSGANVRMLGVSLDTASRVLSDACVHTADELQPMVVRLERERSKRRRAVGRIER